MLQNDFLFVFPKKFLTQLNVWLHDIWLEISATGAAYISAYKYM